jgi:hypothetical protein
MLPQPHLDPHDLVIPHKLVILSVAKDLLLASVGYLARTSEQQVLPLVRMTRSWSSKRCTHACIV